jgi:hypothetical protein
MLSEAALPRAIEMWCAGESSEAQRSEGLNTVLVQVHRGTVPGLNALVAGHLRPYLTSEDGATRNRGCKLLATVLQRLPEMRLEANVVGALARFFTERYVSDYESTGPCVAALRSLLELHSAQFPPELVAPCLRTVLGEHSVQSMTQSSRSAAYGVALAVAERPRLLSALASADGDMSGGGARSSYSGAFVGHMADAMDGEKDPRCLLLSLRALAALVAEGALVHGPGEEERAVQRAFDVSSVYFPIVFRPPANDPFNIRAEDLWSALHGVFKAHPLMAPQVLGMLLDKLSLPSSDLVSVKADSLRTLRVCVPAFGARNVAPFLAPLRAVLSKLVVSAEQASVAEEAASAAGAVAALPTGSSSLARSCSTAPRLLRSPLTRWWAGPRGGCSLLWPRVPRLPSGPCSTVLCPCCAAGLCARTRARRSAAQRSRCSASCSRRWTPRWTFPANKTHSRWSTSRRCWRFSVPSSSARSARRALPSQVAPARPLARALPERRRRGARAPARRAAPARCVQRWRGSRRWWSGRPRHWSAKRSSRLLCAR